ncbi:hypothetical protein Nepgr_013971 [Nepenthes gracilis]|uniref:Peroxidase n=1 Tax=Nepenthes gracilis TaxID=150966 RepID=A0AAD3SJT5_NEPGR|nr:hypothetical protein Nepgr_013971 [Nepenthes gracilis]
MASTTQLIFVIFTFFSFFFCATTDAQLSPSFYRKTCPKLHGIVRKTMAQAVKTEKRMGASILRLFFHDCFVNGCDGSILLVDTPTFTGEQGAQPNKNSVRGFNVINTIKTNVEKACNATVSCADILALAARDGTVMLGGPSWTVSLGRRDSTTANLTAANADLPPPFANLDTLISMFAAKGLSATDMTALSGAHTIGLGRCTLTRTSPPSGKSTCPFSGGDDNLAPIDLRTPDKFDNKYYHNLRLRHGLFHSDQELFNGGSQDELVKSYSINGRRFARDFAAAMIRMGNISPLTGSDGEIRLKCSVVN